MAIWLFHVYVRFSAARTVARHLREAWREAMTHTASRYDADDGEIQTWLPVAPAAGETNEACFLPKLETLPTTVPRFHNRHVFLFLYCMAETCVHVQCIPFGLHMWQ